MQKLDTVGDTRKHTLCIAHFVTQCDVATHIFGHKSKSVPFVYRVCCEEEDKVHTSPRTEPWNQFLSGLAIPIFDNKKISGVRNHFIKILDSVNSVSPSSPPVSSQEPPLVLKLHPYLLPLVRELLFRTREEKLTINPRQNYQETRQKWPDFFDSWLFLLSAP